MATRILVSKEWRMANRWRLVRANALVTAAARSTKGTTMISKIHNTETCDAANGQPCEMCEWADKQESESTCKHGTSGYCFPCVRERHNQDMLDGRFDEDSEREQVLHSITESVVENVKNEVFSAETRRSVFADTGVIRAAIADVVDGAEFYKWMWDKNETNADAVRAEFTDAVIARIAAFQRRGLGAKLENFCTRHLKARLPRPTVSICADCVAERE